MMGPVPASSMFNVEGMPIKLHSNTGKSPMETAGTRWAYPAEKARTFCFAK